jgi:hypothetical protein
MPRLRTYRAYLFLLTFTTNFFVASSAAAIDGWAIVGPTTLGRDVIALAASPTRFVALTDSSALLWSDDGAVWQRATSLPPVHQVSRLAYGNGLFVGVGNGAVRSSDGVTWTFRRIPQSAFTALGFNGTRFIAAGATAPTVATSTDGVTWTTVNGAPTSFGTDAFVVVGNGTALVHGTGTTLLRSTDGVTWQTLTSPVAGGRAFWDGAQFVFGGAAGPYYGSPDGVTWTLLPGFSTEIPRATATLGGAAFYLYDDRVDHGSGAANPGGGVTATSPEAFHAIAATNSGVIAAGDAGAWFRYQDAVGWQQLGGASAANGDEGPRVSVEFGGMVLAWTAGNGTVSGPLAGRGQIEFVPGHLLRSADGVAWSTPVVAAPPAPGAALGNVVVFGGALYTVSADRLYSSGDGLSWTEVRQFPWPLATVAADATTLIVSGSTATEMGISSSTDAVNWSNYTFTNADAVPFVPVRIVKTHLDWWAFCSGNGVWKSADGIAWNHFTPLGINNVGSVSAADNRIWFTARNTGLTRWTDDGVSWFLSPNHLRFGHAPVWDGARWFAVANSYNGAGDGPEHLPAVYESADGDAWHIVRDSEFADPRLVHAGAEGTFALGAGATALRRTSLEPLVAQVPNDFFLLPAIAESANGSLATISGAPPGASFHIIYDGQAPVNVTLNETTGDFTVTNAPPQTAAGVFDYYAVVGGRLTNRGRVRYQLTVTPPPPPTGGGGGGAIDPLLALAFAALTLRRRRRSAAA